MSETTVSDAPANNTISCSAAACGHRWVAIGALLAGLAVVSGAFAAHGLDDFFAKKYAGEVRTVVGSEIPAATKYLNDFKTAAEYQMYHALGLIGVGLMLAGRESRRCGLQATAWQFLIGILLFSGSLYLLTLTGQRWLGAIAPIGGTALITAWITWAITAWKSK